MYDSIMELYLSTKAATEKGTLKRGLFMLKKVKTDVLRRVDIQVFIFTAAVAIISCLFISVLYYGVTHRDMIRSLEDRVYSIHNFIVNNVDKDTFANLNSPEDIDTVLYQKAHSVFKNAQDVTGVLYLYSAKQNSEGKFIYVVDCIDPEAEDFRNPGDLIEPEIVPEMTRALNGEEVMPHKIKNTEWGKIYIAYLPVRDGDEIVGVIGVEFEAEHQYNTYHTLLLVSPIEVVILCTACMLVAKILFRRISNPLYKDMFNTDYLTNLKSRNAFEVDVANLGARRISKGIGFYVIDLNGLKRVNDTLGHEAGDIYIQTAAHSFRDAAGENITIYRTGGDEFVLLSKDDTISKMGQLTQEMIALFDKRKPLWEVPLSFSIGYALFDPSIDSDFSDTYRRADKRMYEQKRVYHAENP